MAYPEKRVSEAKGSKGKVTWRARYKKPDGTFGSEPGFPTKKTAKQWGEEQEAAIRAGRWIDPDLSRKTFGVWTREWMKAKAPRGNTKTTRWNRLDAHIMPRWEHVPLNGITWFDAETWANGLDCDDVTATHCLTLMSQILTGAVDAKHLLVNPLYGRRRSKPATVKEQIRSKEEKRWAPPEVVLQLARRVGPRDGMHILTTAFTGMRWGESIGLRRECVLVERREPHDGGFFACPTLSIVEEVAEYQERDEDGNKLGMVLALEPVKTRESKRQIDVPPFLAELLERHLDVVKHDFVFCTKDGKWWRRSNFGRQVMRPAADGRKALTKTKGHAERAAWDPITPGLTMRDLRHTHDTYQEEIGVRPALMFEQAGHKRPGIKAVYQHPTPTMRKERLDGLQEIYERAMKSLGWKSVWGS